MDTISSAHGTAVAASSSSLCHSNRWKYEVFLSFRGDNTRTTFTDHLSIALHNAGIHTLIDWENIQSELDQEIKGSRNTFVCLHKEVRGVWMVPEELAKIMRCQEDQEGKVVYPILYLEMHFGSMKGMKIQMRSSSEERILRLLQFWVAGILTNEVDSCFIANSSNWSAPSMPSTTTSNFMLPSLFSISLVPSQHRSH